MMNKCLRFIAALNTAALSGRTTRNSYSALDSDKRNTLQYAVEESSSVRQLMRKPTTAFE
jgi:hypothetical protein